MGLEWNTVRVRVRDRLVELVDVGVWLMVLLVLLLCVVELLLVCCRHGARVVGRQQISRLTSSREASLGVE